TSATHRRRRRDGRRDRGAAGTSRSGSAAASRRRDGRARQRRGAPRVAAGVVSRGAAGRAIQGRTMPVEPLRLATPPARRASLASLLALALLGLAALVAAHALLWRWTGDRIEAGFEAWARTRRATDWQVQHGPPQRGGWPFAATLRLPEFRLAGGAATVPG